MDIYLFGCYYHIEIFDVIKSWFCNHEYEGNGVDSGQFHEHSVWCKKCGKSY